MAGKQLFYFAALLGLALGQTVKEVEPIWWANLRQSAREAIHRTSDSIKTRELLGQTSIASKSCGGKEHAMQVSEVQFDMAALKLKVRGEILREIAGGNVTMDLKLGEAPAGLGRLQQIKRQLAFAAAVRGQQQEPLCKHLKRVMDGSGGACPLRPGDRELLFGFDRLPRAVTAGKYRLELRVTGPSGEPVLCAVGEADVPLGPQGQVFRRLQKEDDDYYGYYGYAVSSASRAGAAALLVVLAACMATLG